jgi:hypothetical protein
VHNSGGASPNVPQTLQEVDLPGRIRAAGGSSLKQAGDFFGWQSKTVTKSAADFTRDELVAKGWTGDRLLDVADGYDHVARITPRNPSATLRAVQLRELAKLFD